MQDFEYDYIIVGSGLFGSVFAHEAKKRGKKCLVLEKRPHLGGNVYCETIDGIITHKYGAHIFHTNDDRIWNYVTALTPFEPYVHYVKVFIEGRYYSFPFNIKTFKELWSIEDGAEALDYFLSQTNPGKIPSNLEEKGRAELGDKVFELFVKGYTEKQWGRNCVDLPASILSRIPVRNEENDQYFSDKYQGLPEGGYNRLIGNLLKGTDYKIGTDFFDNRPEWERKGRKIVFTGPIDELSDYRFGRLEYRSLRFENERLEMNYFQPVSVVNYPEIQVPYTRVIEHKHFHNQEADHTLITREYPQEFDGRNEPYYPIVDTKNLDTLKQYMELVDKDKYIIGGRLGEFKYYDMHQIIGSALKKADMEFGEESR